jgi:hypothetical protein
MRGCATTPRGQALVLRNCIVVASPGSRQYEVAQAAFEIGPNGLVIGANDSLIGVLLPFIEAFRRKPPDARVDLKPDSSP